MTPVPSARLVQGARSHRQACTPLIQTQYTQLRRARPLRDEPRRARLTYAPYGPCTSGIWARRNVAAVKEPPVTTPSPSAPGRPEHRFQLGGSAWWLWHDAVFRSTGFPVGGLSRLSAPELARLTDAHLAGGATVEDVEAAVARTAEAQAREIDALVTDERLREAVIWEQASAPALLDALADTAGQPRDDRRRELENAFGRLWQRYSAVNDTIGFFGPFVWATLDPRAARTVATAGPVRPSRREVFLEAWAMAAYGARLAERPELRRWMPLSPRTHHFLDGDAIRRPGLPPITVTPEEAQAIALCDGRRPAAVAAADLAAAGVLGTGVDEAAALRFLSGLVTRRLLEWNENLPVGPETEDVLAERIASIGDEELRAKAQEGLDAIRSARDKVAAAAGDPDSLLPALEALNAVFTDVTGRAPRRPGHGYPGSNVCYEDTIRDADVTLGGDVLAPVTPALTIALQAARWLTAELAHRFETALAELIRVKHAGATGLSLADVWDDGLEMLLGTGRNPFPDVLSEFETRWRELLELDDDARRQNVASARLRERAERLFAADRPGWSLARIHSPDLLLCAPSIEAINEGLFLAVLGELHVAYATYSIPTLTWAQPDPHRLIDLAVQDYGRPRMIPLVPAVWSRYAKRSLQFYDHRADRYIGFARATGVAADRVVSTGSVAIEPTAEGLAGRPPGGALIPLTEFFGTHLSMCCTNAFREVMQGAAHTPRVTIDNLVIWRETWRLTRAEIAALAAPTGEAAAYLAGRRLVTRRGLPERCFVRLSTVKKPIYVDFTSPLYVSLLGSMIRSALNGTGRALDVTVTEMLPDLDATWLRDTEGNRYLCEFRLQVTDAEPAR
ncbi:lantibiotic dehydratase [Actinomadura syzygii]|uniref:Lantibiotic dehydratase n=1 Tax=Actinomadura syzygii TaxID=1427538 RepID=A0A5D0TVZ7_9ACTN|nr:lantibiotic dehydratase [Actinomadura syzygii]